MFESLFGQQKPLSLEQIREIVQAYPQGCFYHWDGRGQLPVGTLLVFDEFHTVAATCPGCRISDCQVRMAEYTGNKR